MHCPNCGKELKDHQKFCGGCGSDVSSLWQQAAPVAAAPAAPATVEAAPAPAVPAPVEAVPGTSTCSGTRTSTRAGSRTDGVRIRSYRNTYA